MIGAGLALVGQFLGSKLGPPMFLVIGAAAALGWGLWYAEDKAHQETIAIYAGQVSTLKGNVVTIETALSDQRASYDALVLEQQEQRIARIKLDYEYASILKERDEAINKLQSYRSRWSNVANKKPKLLSRIINRATDKRVHSLYTRTCRADCGEDGNQDGNAGATTSPESNR